MSIPLRHEFSRAASSYDEAAVLAHETGLRMAERLDYVKIAPARVADIGCATGDGILELQRRYPKAQALALDFALPMLQAVRARTPRLKRLLRSGPQLLNADVNAVPLAAGSLGLVWSNLMLHWLDDPLPAFRELHRVLEVGGLLMFAALGPDTLKELRSAGSVRKFHDMHDLGDMLLAAGFADPVMDMELIRFDYSSPRRFLADQRHLGVRDALLGQLAWQQWRRIFAAARSASPAGSAGPANHFPVSFEIVFGHAWKAAPTPAATDHSVIRFHPAAGPASR